MPLLNRKRAHIHVCVLRFVCRRVGLIHVDFFRRDAELKTCQLATLVFAAFALIPGEDPTYVRIEAGAWPDDAPYATIHRLAADGTGRGVTGAVIAWCAAQSPVLRADTHADNAPMQHLLEKHGFVRCGIIYTDDGTPRLAYQRG